jgi:PAS domain S-box-containing protein
MAPMFDQPESGAAPIGAVLLQIDATKFLNRVTEWPVVTETAETMLVRRQGEDVVFLNELRFQTGAVLNFRIPMTRTNVPSVMAVLGWQGVVEGTDYRGHAVLAALRPVPDSPWHIAAKTDTAQALADWRSRRELILALLVLMVLGLGTAAWVATQQRNRVVALTRLTEALREREARLADVAGLNEKLLGAATLGIQVFDAAGACVLTNAAAAQTVGGTVEQLRAQNFRQIVSWQKSGMLAAAEQALGSGQTQRKEISLVSTFQRELVLDCTFSRFESGGQPHLLLVLADITERKQLEAKQQSLVEELRRSNADLEQFAYVASHDLKAPLRAIDSLAGWLEEDLGPALKDENRKHLSLLRQRTKRMERLLEDLLAYSRAGRVTADVAPVAIPHLVAEIAELLNPPAGFSVQLLPTGTAPAGFATAVTPLRQVLYNLVANAVKHHDRAQGAIEVGVESKGDLVEFTVADDGPGIAPEFHRRIFGMFQTLRPRDEVEGSGMGLAMVERIVTRYGGQVTVECRQPRGSMFRFTWPQTIKEPPNHDFAHD